MATNRQQFFAPVKKVKSIEVFPKMNFSDHNDHCVIVDRPDGGGEQVVNFVSERYGLLENKQFFTELEKQLRANKLRFETDYNHIDYCKYYASYKVEGRDLSVGQTKYMDKIKPMIQIQRSYSSQIGFRLLLGFYRQICSNGMFGLKTQSVANLKHTVGNLDKMYETINTTIQRFLEESKDTIEQFQVAGDREIVNWEDRVMEITANTSFPKKSIEQVINRINFESNQNNLPITDWLIYNGFNYQLNHSQGIGGSPEAKIKLDKELFKHIIDNPFDAKFDRELVLA